MGGESYSAAGGSLKLKGVVGSKVEKKKKKRKVTDDAAEKQRTESVPTAPPGEQGTEETEGTAEKAEKDALTVSEADAGKTEAERRHDELRRQRLLERVKREGVKTHKERVEELNKYLSNLSEHHDMPRIGPG